MLTSSHPSYASITRELRTSGGYALTDYRHSPKLVALRQLLFECGIGHDDMKAGADDEEEEEEEDSKHNDDEDDESTVIEAPIPIRHRVLIFAQIRGMLDLVESSLFASVLPSVSYLRLDGTIDSKQRFAIAQQV